MSLFAISDLHLSFSKIKPMDIFGEIWENHAEKIKSNWLRLISDGDTVLIPGDLSWAINLKEFESDILFVNSLPGKKIIIPGNHDYWWNSTARLNEIYEGNIFLKNSYVKYGNTAICGVKGWLCPGDPYFKEGDQKLYLREVNRLRLSLESAARDGLDEIILTMHFPPASNKNERSAFIDLIEYYPVKKVVYGHLHGEDCFDSCIKGVKDGVEYVLTSCDYLNFIPLKIL